VIHRLHFPKLPLSQFVENIWYVQGQHVDYAREKILPDGAIELIIDLDSWPKKIFDDEITTESYRTVKRAWISGERTRYIVIGTDNTHLIGIRFKPGGAYPFFGFPISELSEYVTELDLIWGRLVYDIRDQLLEIDSPEEKLLRLESFLLEQGVAPWNELPLWVPSTDPDHLGFARVDCSRAVAAGLVTRPLGETVDAVLDEFATLVDDDPRRRGKLTAERERELIARWRERAKGRDASGGAPP